MTNQSGPDRHEQTPSGRRETDQERQDRLWTDLLQELRVMQTGAQLTAGFLLTLPFHSRFTELADYQLGLYLALVILALLTTVLVMSAVAVHQRLSGLFVKEQVVRTGRRLIKGVLVTLALLIIGLGVFLTDMVLPVWAALLIGAAFAALLLFLVLVLPRRLLRNG